MSKKLLAGLVVVGGGVWYYDQNIHPIFSNDEKLQHQVANAKQQAQPSDETTKELRKLDNKARDFGSQLKTTANKSTEEIRSKTDSTLENVKDSDLYKKWSKKLDSYGDDVKLAAEEIENKPAGHRLAAKYIEFVNGLGQTDEEKLKELASSNPRRQREIRAELERSQQSWGDWFSGKKDKLDDKAEQAKRDAEQKKDSWFNWGQDKKDELDLKAQDAKKDLQKEKDGWLNWGQDKKDELDKKAQQAKKDAEKEKDGWLNWGQDKKEELDKKAQQAKKDAENKKDGWLNWGQDKKEELDDKAQQAKKDAEQKKDSWLNWGSDKKDQLAKDAENAKKDANLTWNQQSKELSDSLEAGKQRALDEYYRAKKQVEDLTKQASEKTASVLGNGNNKAQEVNPDDRYLTKAKEDLQNAFTNLSKYGGDLVDQADRAIRGNNK